MYKTAERSLIFKKLEEGRYPKHVEKAVADIALSPYTIDGHAAEPTKRPGRQRRRKDRDNARSQLVAQIVELAEIASESTAATHGPTLFEVLTARATPGSLTCAETTANQAFVTIVKLLTTRSGWGPDAATITALVHSGSAAAGRVSLPVCNGVVIGFGMTVRKLRRTWTVQFDYGLATVYELDMEDECSVQGEVDLFAACMKTNLTPPRGA